MKLHRNKSVISYTDCVHWQRGLSGKWQLQQLNWSCANKHDCFVDMSNFTYVHLTVDWGLVFSSLKLLSLNLLTQYYLCELLMSQGLESGQTCLSRAFPCGITLFSQKVNISRHRPVLSLIWQQHLLQSNNLFSIRRLHLITSYIVLCKLKY